MDAATLVRSQPGLSLARAQALINDCNDALILAGATTVNRAAMFLAQIGHESVSLRYTEEIQKIARYSPYIGRTFIQITWDYNYRAFGQYAVAHHIHGLTDPARFVNHPAELAADAWAWYGAVWYWTTHNLNAPSDARDFNTVTRIINGGTNGWDDRLNRYKLNLGLGNAILPRPAAPPPPPVKSVPAADGPDRVVYGGQLKPGQSKANGDKRLVMQTDGNLVLYHGSRAIWATGTNGRTGAFLAVQTDGNIVLYQGTTPIKIWHTAGTGVNQLVVQGDGNLVAYDATGHAKWASGTAGK